MQVIITVELSTESAEAVNYATLNYISNTIRRCAHEIEATEPPSAIDGGAVLNLDGKPVGTWSVK